MRKTLLILSFLTFLNGCKVFRAVDSANSIPEKLDSTYAQIEKTNKQMADTNDGIRLQKMQGALDDMLKERNSTDLEPVALGMVEGADIFTKAATADELIKNTWVLLNQIKDAQPDDSQKDENGDLPAAVIQKYDHQKMVQFSELIVLAGLAPEEKVNKIIRDEIYAGGLYQDEAYVFLMARVYFLSAYLDNKILSRKLNTVKKMQEAIDKMASIDKILKLPFKNMIGMNIVGFIEHPAITEFLYTCKRPNTTNPDGSTKIGKSVSCTDPRAESTEGVLGRTWNAPAIWQTINEAFSTDLKEGNLVSGNEENSQAVSERIADMKNQVGSFVSSWAK